MRATTNPGRRHRDSPRVADLGLSRHHARSRRSGERGRILHVRVREFTDGRPACGETHRYPIGDRGISAAGYALPAGALSGPQPLFDLGPSTRNRHDMREKSEPEKEHPHPALKPLVACALTARARGRRRIVARLGVSACSWPSRPIILRLPTHVCESCAIEVASQMPSLVRAAGWQSGSIGGLDYGSPGLVYSDPEVEFLVRSTRLESEGRCLGVVRRGCNASGGFAGQVAAVVAWVARKRSVPRDVAEEAVQEALLQLVELSARAIPADVEGWLRRTAERRLIDSERHRRTQVPSWAESEVGAEGRVTPDMDAVLALRSSLRTLAPDRRKLVVLQLSGASWREVAAATGLAEDVARKRFESALAELRELMGNDDRA